MNNPFIEVDNKALEKYYSKYNKYGDSWKNMKIYELLYRLREEYKELSNARDLKEVNNEALDVINVARMIAERTKEE